MSFRTREKEIESGTGGAGGPAGGDLSGSYPNPQVVDDSHSHTDLTIAFPHYEAPFDKTSSPSLLLKALVPGDKILEVTVEIVTPFDAGVGLSLGFPAAPGAIALVGKIIPQIVGKYKFYPYRKSIVNENFTLFFYGPAPTQGTGIVFVDE